MSKENRYLSFVASFDDSHVFTHAVAYMNKVKHNDTSVTMFLKYGIISRKKNMKPYDGSRVV